MKIIVGLGTPEERFTFNRQNIGLLVIDYLAETYGISSRNEPLLDAIVGIGDILCQKVALVKPTTSSIGSTIKQCMEHFNVSYDDILVIYDDVHLPFDKILFRDSGGSEGHKGIQDIISLIGNDCFPRLKYGIGDFPKDTALLDYLHSDFTKTERDLIQDRLPCLRLPIEMFVWRSIVPVMNTFN